MYSKTGLAIMNLVLKLLGCYLCCCISVTNADNSSTSLTVKPERCIALQQGQTCYVRLSFKWITPTTGEYCLFDESRTKPLVCWSGNATDSYKLMFRSDKNVNYQIRSKLGEQTLAEALVKISWIYKSNTSSTSRWRLF